MTFLNRPRGLDKEQEDKQWSQLGCNFSSMASWRLWAVSEARLLERYQGSAGREAREHWGTENWSGVRQGNIEAWRNNSQPMVTMLLPSWVWYRMWGWRGGSYDQMAEARDEQCHISNHATPLQLTELHKWELLSFLDDPFGYQSLVSPWPPERKGQGYSISFNQVFYHYLALYLLSLWPYHPDHAQSHLIFCVRAGVEAWGL